VIISQQFDIFLNGQAQLQDSIKIIALHPRHQPFDREDCRTAQAGGRQSRQLDCPQHQTHPQRYLAPHSGKILKDETPLETLKLSDGETFHAVIKQPEGTKPAASSAPSSNPTSNPQGTGATGSEQPNAGLGGMGGFGGMGGMGGLGGMGGMGGLGGMGGMGGLGGMDPQMMANMMDMVTPEMMEQMVNSNPMLKQMADSNPQVKAMISNPQMMKEMLRNMSNYFSTQIPQ
jgi:hypothetical protein